MNKNEVLEKNIKQLAHDLTKHPESIEIFLWEAYWGEMLGFDDEGNAYHRHSGDKFIPENI
jgi:hypothetical protein